MGCRLTNNITKENCVYTVAGIVAVYLINYMRGIEYTENADGVITAITKDEGVEETLESFKIDFEKNTASFSDDLAEGGNGGKYRTHTVNFTVGKIEYDKMNEADALSLGKFIAVVVDKNGQTFMLGRGNGLDASAFNYASGAADADASGWTVTLAGNEKETMRPLENEAVVTAILHKDTEVIP